jgi:hypothetical protein
MAEYRDWDPSQEMSCNVVFYLEGITEKIATDPTIITDTVGLRFIHGCVNGVVAGSPAYFGTIAAGLVTVGEVKHINVTVDSAQQTGLIVELRWNSADVVYDPGNIFPVSGATTLGGRTPSLEVVTNYNQTKLYNARGVIFTTPAANTWLMQLTGTLQVEWEVLLPPVGFQEVQIIVNDDFERLSVRVAVLEAKVASLLGGGGIVGVLLGIVDVIMSVVNFIPVLGPLGTIGSEMVKVGGVMAGMANAVEIVLDTGILDKISKVMSAVQIGLSEVGNVLNRSPTLQANGPALDAVFELGLAKFKDAASVAGIVPPEALCHSLSCSPDQLMPGGLNLSRT